MSKPISGIFSTALTLTMVLPGYSAETPTPNPTITTTDSVMETGTTPRWTVVIDPPKGWLLTYPHTPYDTIVVRGSYKKGDREGISVGSLSNNELRKYSDHMKFSFETEMVDIDAYRDAWLANEDAYHRDISDVQSMGSRAISGEYAAGSTYTLTTDKGEVHACQLWHVRRPEGMWSFHICSAPGGTDIAPELLTALETIRWVDIPPTFSCSKAKNSNYPCQYTTTQTTRQNHSPPSELNEMLNIS